MNTLGRFLLVLALLALPACGGSAGPGAAAESFFRAIDEGNVSVAAELITGSVVTMFGKDGVTGFLSHQSAQAQQAGGITTIQILSEEVRGEMATVKLRIETQDGQSGEADVSLAKVDNQWKVLVNME